MYSESMFYESMFMNQYVPKIAPALFLIKYIAELDAETAPRLLQAIVVVE